MKFAACFSALAALAFAQPEGIWQGYDGEWLHVSQQLVALAEATPADKFSWRPAADVRSTSEVYMHIITANFWLLSYTGVKVPDDIAAIKSEKSVIDKAEIIRLLKRSLEAVKTARAQLKPGISKETGDRKAQRHSRWYLPAHHHPCQRTHGTTCGLCAHERNRAALVGQNELGCRFELLLRLR